MKIHYQMLQKILDSTLEANNSYIGIEKLCIPLENYINQLSEYISCFSVSLTILM